MNEIELLRALGDPIRLRIIMLLICGDLCICDLTAVLSMPQSTVSRHMSRLKAAGLADDRREGRWIHYSLASEPLLDEMSGFFKRLRQVDPYWQDIQKLHEHRKTTSCQ